MSLPADEKIKDRRQRRAHDNKSTTVWISLRQDHTPRTLWVLLGNSDGRARSGIPIDFFIEAPTIWLQDHGVMDAPALKCHRQRIDMAELFLPTPYCAGYWRYACGEK